VKISFAYKGRYHVRDAVTIEHLSAVAKRYGHETGLIYDQDIFGVTDNVCSLPALSRIFSYTKKTVAKAASGGSSMIVFLDGFTRREWNDEVSRGIKEVNGGIKTVFLSYIEPRGSYDHTLIGEPEFAFDRFFADNIFDSPGGVCSFKGLADLDALPLPDKSLFAPYVNFRDSYMIYTSKGCRYGCSYCEETIYESALDSGYFRRRSPGNVISELEAAKKEFGSREIIYKDSIFALDKRWLKEYLAEYARRIAVPYKCFGKAEAFDGELAQALRKSGCYCVEFGVQTFNESLKRDVLNRKEKTRDLLKAFSVCDRYKLRYDADHLFGIPGETAADHREAASIYSSLCYLNRIKCHNLVFYREAGIFEHAPQSARDARGRNCDFFSSVSGEGAMVKANRVFQKLFKVLPLLPGAARRFFIRRDNWKSFRFVPGVLVTLFMLILAAKNGDRRFFIYLKHYPVKLARAAFSAVLRNV
jgi:anaerobic magnesium-protoporphyrin IX monomethyl ester cyclase